VRREERGIVAAFAITALAGIGLVVTYWNGGQPQLEGLLLAVGFGGLCVGLVRWANTILERGGPYEQQRHELASTDEDRKAFEADFEREGIIGRRSVIVKALGAAVGAMGVAALFPLRSLGPKPGRSLVETPWRAGLKLVNDRGAPVHASDVPIGGLVTVFPEGHPGSADGQAVLVRVEEGLLQPEDGRESWSPDGFVCYSKLCTHAGCPVGLYQADTHELLCPCHQSTFDVLRGAEPVFGPAAAPLPQLPLRIGDDGVLRAGGDFSDPVGPSFWRHQ
jgi:ubiquinol-cytochrome c reductase iron-sulfur subunit